MAKVTFDGINKKIIVNTGITFLDIKVDLYSDWKEWLSEPGNSKYIPAMRTIGGDSTVGTKTVAPYYFLTNGWKIRPYEGNHTLDIAGNLFVDEQSLYGTNITIPTLGTFNVLINLSTTSDASVITVTSGSGLSAEEHNKLFAIVADVWNELVSAHAIIGSTGKTMKDIKNNTLAGL